MAPAALQEAEKRAGFQGRKIGRRHSEVRELRAGDLIRYTHGEHRAIAGTIISHHRTKKGAWRSLVHRHDTGELVHVPHSHVTHVRKTPTLAKRRTYLRLARIHAHGRRADTQSLSVHDPERLLAANRAHRVDEALRGLGTDVARLDPAESRRELGSDEVTQLVTHEPAPHPPFEAGSIRHLQPGVAEAHPKHLRVGDEARYHADSAGRGITKVREGAGANVLTGGTGTGRRGIVLGHNAKAGLLHVWDPNERRERVVPYSSVHHVKHLSRSGRQDNVRQNVGGKHRAPALRSIKADTSRHRRLVDDAGQPAFFRTPTYVQHRGAFPHGGTAYPSAPGDVHGEEYDFGRDTDTESIVGASVDSRHVPVHAMGGLEPYVEFTGSDGEFREAALQEAGEATHRCPRCGHKLRPAGHRGYADAERSGHGHMAWRCPQCHLDFNPASDRPRRLSEAAELLEAAAGNTGAMVALYPPRDVARKVAIAGGEKPEDMHVTLAFLGKAADVKDPAKLKRVLAGWAAATPPLEGRITGLTLFTPSPHSDGKMVTTAGIQVRHLSRHRAVLAQLLHQSGAPASDHFEYHPHLTLAYGDRRNGALPDHAVRFDRVSLKLGDERHDFPLRGEG